MNHHSSSPRFLSETTDRPNSHRFPPQGIYNDSVPRISNRQRADRWRDFEISAETWRVAARVYPRTLSGQSGRSTKRLNIELRPRYLASIASVQVQRIVPMICSTIFISYGSTDKATYKTASWIRVQDS